jgi:5-methylcytosine-specific restriction endonuclease McrA
MAKAKTPKPYNWDVKIMSALRKVWRFSPERRAAIDAARVLDFHNEVWCASCNARVHVKLAAVDHVEPIVLLTGFDSWDGVIHRLRTNPMQILCDSCHKAKTKAENAQRRALKPKKEKKCKSNNGHLKS